MIASGTGIPEEPLLGIPGSIIAIAILIVMSGFFAGSETALTGVSKARMHTLSKEGNKRAAMVNKIRERKDNMIGALMLGNTAVHVLASALTANVFIILFGQAGVIYASLVMTFLMLVFGEVMPKTYALHHADSMAMKIAPLIQAVIKLFAPITALITWTVRFSFRIFGMDVHKVKYGSHLEVLRGAIELHQGPGQETQDQRAMLRSILDLVEVNVKDIMIHRNNVSMIDLGQDNDKIIDDILHQRFTRIPLWKENQDNIVGILHAKVLLRELRENAQNMTKINIQDIAMEPWFIPETTNLYDQLQAFRERREHFAIVVDEYGVFMGIVTLEDILEEIVGEIDDEQDAAVPGVRRLQGGIYLVDGTVTIRDLNREFDWRLPDKEYSTLAGLILFESQMVPQAGQSFSFHGFRFDIARRDGNQITLIKVRPPVRKKAKSHA
jgi:Mg2+/Co2+ transporter CorB